MLDVAVREWVPSSIGTGWKVSLPGKGEECLPLLSDYCLQDVLSKLNLGENELSGALGSTWISIGAGTAFSAQCKRAHLFSWHYHPDGDSRFSVEDWISFIVSDAQITLLLTVNHVCLYTKLHKGKWKEISRAITGAGNTSNDRPNLRFVRFIKLMKKEFSASDWTLCAEDQIASALDINYMKDFAR